MTDYIDGYKQYLSEERHASANTLSSYLRDVRQFLAYLQSVGTRSVLQAAASDIEEYMRWMTGRGKSAATVTRSVASLKSYYHYLVLEGRLKKNPVQDVTPLKVKRHLPQIGGDGKDGLIQQIQSITELLLLHIAKSSFSR